MVVPTHFVFDGDREIIVHLARPNPIWPALERCPFAMLSVVDDYAYVPTTWRAGNGTTQENGVPTSYRRVAARSLYRVNTRCKVLGQDFSGRAGMFAGTC